MPGVFKVAALSSLQWKEKLCTDDMYMLRQEQSLAYRFEGKAVALSSLLVSLC